MIYIDITIGFRATLAIIFAGDDANLGIAEESLVGELLAISCVHGTVLAKVKPAFVEEGFRNVKHGLVSATGGEVVIALSREDSCRFD